MWSSSSNAWKRILTVVLVCNSLCWDCDWAPLSYLFAGLERPRPGWGSHEQTERTEDCVLSYLQRRPLDHPLSVQGHPGPHAEGAGWTAWTFHRRQGKACWLWYHHHFNHIIRSWFVFHDPLLRLDGWLFFSFSSWTRACSACTEQDWEVCAAEPEGWRHAEGRVHAAQPQRWV